MAVDLNMRILIVDDYKTMLRIMRNLLRQLGFENVEEASDGSAALALLQGGTTFDLIISDIEMPKMSGFDLARSIRKIPKYATTPLMAVSSRADDKYQAEGMSAGFDLYMEKLKPDTFLSAIYQLAQEQRKAS